MSKSEITYHQKSKTVWHKDPVSGHEWPEEVMLQGFEVHGGFFCTTSHTTEAGALKEIDYRERTNRMFPWKCPVSQREVDRCKQKNMEIDWDKYVLVA